MILEKCIPAKLPKLIFYVGSYSIGDRTRFLESSDETGKCTEKCSEISKQNIKKFLVTGVNIRLRKRRI
jgi:hypothetical protein